MAGSARTTTEESASTRPTAAASAMRDARGSPAGIRAESRRPRPLLLAYHAIVSEALGDLPGAWLEVPESTALVIEAGTHEQRPFRPRPS